MNAPHYRIANSDLFQADYSDDREFFDVYSNPIRSFYSQVHWKEHGNIPLPPEIIERFANGKVMAITGYEVDQVMQLEGNEVPVPITWAYNHHYMAYLLNSKTAKLSQVQATEDNHKMAMNHGASTIWQAQVFNEGAHDFPQVHFFSEGNGGEMRMSYHGYPKGYAQILQSPNTFHVVPMQIDTWNRDMSNSTFLPGPMPKNSPIPSSAGYNGLLECPCTDRLPKEWNMTYQLYSENCHGTINNASECFLAAPQVIPSTNYTTRTVDDPSVPSGCTASLREDGSLQATWNTAVSFNQPLDLTSKLNSERVVGVALGVVNLTLSLATIESNDAAQILMTGPVGSWFGVGFGADSMCIHMESDECPTGGPYAIIIFDDRVEERKLGFHGPGEVLSSSIQVILNKVENGLRTVLLSRRLQGDSNEHYTFDSTQNEMDTILATGCGMEFGQHCGHGAAHLSFLPVNTMTKICEGGIQGTIGGEKFTKECAPYPRSDLLEQRNPSCWVETYQGGLHCCRHGHFLLDQDQIIPWPDKPLEYRLKFRFYFEEYRTATEQSPASHENLVRFYLMTEAFSGEYDIPQCSEGTPPSQCVHTITSRSKLLDLVSDCKTIDSSYCSGEGSRDESKTAGVHLIYAGPHCHAPSCLSMELYNADTGRLLCHVEPIYGTSHDVYDEVGFLALPPCLWGDMADGLEEPVLLPLNTTLLSIKRNNNTLPHTGDMASWQMRGVIVPRKDDEPDDSSSSTIARPLLRSYTTKERKETRK